MWSKKNLMLELVDVATLYLHLSTHYKKKKEKNSLQIFTVWEKSNKWKSATAQSISNWLLEQRQSYDAIGINNRKHYAIHSHIYTRLPWKHGTSTMNVKWTVNLSLLVHIYNAHNLERKSRKENNLFINYFYAQFKFDILHSLNLLSLVSFHSEK